MVILNVVRITFPCYKKCLEVLTRHREVTGVFLWKFCL